MRRVIVMIAAQRIMPSRRAAFVIASQPTVGGQPGEGPLDGPRGMITNPLGRAGYNTEVKHSSGPRRGELCASPVLSRAVGGRRHDPVDLVAVSASVIATLCIRPLGQRHRPQRSRSPSRSPLLSCDELRETGQRELHSPVAGGRDQTLIDQPCPQIIQLRRGSVAWFHRARNTPHEVGVGEDHCIRLPGTSP